MIWRDYLKPEETARLAELAQSNRDIKAEQRRIYDRCRKRLIASKEKEA